MATSCVSCNGSGLYADELSLSPVSELRAMLAEHPCRMCKGSGTSRRRQPEDSFTTTVDGAAGHAGQMHRDLFGRYL